MGEPAFRVEDLGRACQVVSTALAGTWVFSGSTSRLAPPMQGMGCQLKEGCLPANSFRTSSKESSTMSA